jgi:UDP-N-acetyl-D-glucosamine dehydrogenase
LSWKTRQAGIEARFIELAGYINGQMPHFVVDKVQNALNEAAKPLKGSHIHVLGVAYKRDIDDVRESPALDIMHLLGRRGARLTYFDPYIPEIDVEGHRFRSESDPALVSGADCVLIVTDHKSFDYAQTLERAQLIVDTRNAMQGFSSPKIVRL